MTPGACHACRHWTRRLVPDPKRPWDVAARPAWGDCAAHDGVMTSEWDDCPAFTPKTDPDA